MRVSREFLTGLCNGSNGKTMKWRSLEESKPGQDTRPLREQLAERKALIEKLVPPATQAIHRQVVDDLQHSGIAQRTLKPGAQAPTFALPDHNGKLIASTDLLTRARLILTFIRGRWDPFCCGQLEAMNLYVPQFERAGATVAFISPQTVRHSFFMHDQHKPRFPLLSDAGNQVARQFGLVYRVPNTPPTDQQEIYRRVFINLPNTNGDSSWELPIPATYVLDRDGTILYASANADYTERPEPEEILAALERDS
jgi:peroxiredoxin